MYDQIREDIFFFMFYARCNFFVIMCGFDFFAVSLQQSIANSIYYDHTYIISRIHLL